jgi:hypothetical protein
MDQFSYDEKRKAALRELGQRKHVYPRLVAAGKMSRSEANYQIAIMDAIREDYETLSVKERLL